MAKSDNNSTYIIIALIILAIIGGFYYFKTTTRPGVINEGAALGAVVVDANGQVLRELQAVEPFSIIAPGLGGGFTSIDNVVTFLAIRSRLDNSANDAEVQIRAVSGINPCDTGNTNPGCSTIANKYGGGTIECTFNADGTVASCPTNDKFGAITSVYASRFSAVSPLILLAGAQDILQYSEPIGINDIQFGLIRFRLDVTDASFKDAQGNLQPLTGKFGELLLNIQPDTCLEGTTADITPGTNELASCSVSQKGKYCAISYLGTPTLVDKAGFCGCPSGQMANGETCKAVECTTGTCIPGTVYYCVDGSTGQTESRCNQCGVSNCPEAGSTCSLPTDPSTCVPPPVEGTSFNVQVATSSPSQTLSQCGDGTKTGTEQCDLTDFGGDDCLDYGFTGGTLSCKNTVTPGDCTVQTSACTTSSAVRFRTSDLTYGTSTGIAYREQAICGTDNFLDTEKYGHTGTVCRTTTEATCPIISGMTLELDQTKNLPGRPSWAGTNIGCLYRDTASELRIYWKKSALGGPCTTNGQWGGHRYTNTDNDRNAVSSLGVSDGTPSDEVAC